MISIVGMLHSLRFGNFGQGLLFYHFVDLVIVYLIDSPKSTFFGLSTQVLEKIFILNVQVFDLVGVFIKGVMFGEYQLTGGDFLMSFFHSEF